ncbi:hypothetical protein M501DRAFT_1006787 [Patellaria atrata CBS 101060]|uniref:Heterokaryon incompatibility domain-containing protein n=1 Tax=Patellaria atrata CBS 101060 TaxID=1346257 RepID=A0A9P4S8N0_9PEZI|nr:hypothetical protein M501DRAFT_1006787 [Patellaria atrata CBS 101060]
MRLLERLSNGEFSLTENLFKEIPVYAILSYTWGNDDQEIRFCGEQAARDGLGYFWIDTCCIDKSDNNELQEAINSMFRWYCEAARCYVYLSDVSINERIENKGARLGDKKSLEKQLGKITGVPIDALRGNGLSSFSVEDRISWADNRQTKREEDMAYSLMGIFEIHIPLIYGEGEENAFTRLSDAIEKSSNNTHRLHRTKDQTNRPRVRNNNQVKGMEIQGTLQAG